MIRKRVLTAQLVLTIIVVLGLCVAQAAMKVTGKVKDVDLDEQSIVVGDEKGDIVVYLEKSSKIMMGAKAQSLKDIKVGSVIEVSYMNSGGEKIVMSIVLSP